MSTKGLLDTDPPLLQVPARAQAIPHTAPNSEQLAAGADGYEVPSQICRAPPLPLSQTPPTTRKVVSSRKPVLHERGYREETDRKTVASHSLDRLEDCPYLTVTEKVTTGACRENYTEAETLLKGVFTDKARIRQPYVLDMPTTLSKTSGKTEEAYQSSMPNNFTSHSCESFSPFSTLSECSFLRKACNWPVHLGQVVQQQVYHQTDQHVKHGGGEMTREFNLSPSFATELEPQNSASFFLSDGDLRCFSTSRAVLNVACDRDLPLVALGGRNSDSLDLVTYNHIEELKYFKAPSALAVGLHSNFPDQEPARAENTAIEDLKSKSCTLESPYVDPDD
ncbi:hypothetical protein ElyMa_005739500 [Elysia marginata]|uniref:Uncharacterized protein n=1 Tax=Elysia marginata TaxID=1093978 RepID=A0AAV4FKN6_9GAST|nr:hypothetical protein ElyMa_005739500 [Elysia marginata]